MKYGPTTRPSAAAWSGNGGGRIRVAGCGASLCRGRVWQATALQAQASSSLGGFGSETRRRGCAQRPSCASRAGNPPDHAESICLQRGRPGFNPWVGKISWRRKWQPTPVPLPGKSNGWKSLVGYSQGCKESDMISLSLSVAGGIEFIFLLDYQAVVSVFRG